MTYSIGNGRIIHDILEVMIEESVSFKFDMFVLINFWLSEKTNAQLVLNSLFPTLGLVYSFSFHRNLPLYYGY